MLIRYIILYPATEKYLKDEEMEWLLLSRIEQAQIRYLIGIITPFAIFTQVIGQTRGPTLYLVFPIYNKLLGHLEESFKKLGRKNAKWKRAIASGIKLAELKIKEYYSQTKGALSNLYGHAILLAPHLKDTFFKTDDWKGEWEDAYWLSLTAFFLKYYAKLESTRSKQEQSKGSSNLVDSMLGFSTGTSEGSTKVESAKQELSRYRYTRKLIVDFMVDTRLTNIGFNPETTDVLQAWSRLQYDFPRVAQMARDILACTAAGVGVERTFSMARQQASFNQQFSPSSFEARMMILESCRQENKEIARSLEYSLIRDNTLSF